MTIDITNCSKCNKDLTKVEKEQCILLQSTEKKYIFCSDCKDSVNKAVDLYFADHCANEISDYKHIEPVYHRLFAVLMKHQTDFLTQFDVEEIK